MTEKEPDPIEKLLHDLHDDPPFRRREAAEALGKSGANDEEVMSALQALAENDPDSAVRAAAQQARLALGSAVPSAPRPKKGSPIRPADRVLQFLGGFAGWWLINGLLATIPSGLAGANPSPQGCLGSCGGYAYVLFVLCIPLNAVVLLILSGRRRSAALGAVAAAALNLLITVLVGRATEGLLLVPFFAPGFSLF